MSNNFTQEEGNQFIVDCHMAIDKVRAQLEENPDLVHAYNEELIESPLGAAGHMGRADIANLLLENGAEKELAAAAMLGDREYVQAALESDPGLAKSGGAHNIPVAFHAAMSGDVNIMQLLWNVDAEEPVRKALLGAVWKNQVEMARWLLDRDADMSVQNFQGRTALQMAEEEGFDEMLTLLQEYS